MKFRPEYRRGIAVLITMVLLFAGIPAKSSDGGDQPLISCQYSIALYDSFGDGWNGCKLDVFVDGQTVLDDITLASGPGPKIYYFTVGPGSQITTAFFPGSWICEPYYFVYNSEGEQVYYAPNNCNPVIGPGELYGSCPETGSVEGFVFTYDGLAIAGAMIAMENGPAAFSGPDGHYFLDPVPAGNPEVFCGKAGYNLTSTFVEVIAGDTTAQNFTLTQPNMVVYPLSIEQTLNPNEYLTTSLNILNNGTGPLDWTAVVSYITQPVLTCSYSIGLWDSYGDGWNGCALDVLVNGEVVLDNVTLNNGYGPAVYYFEATTGDEVTTDFIPGSWIGEPYYYIYDSQGNQVWYSPPGSSGPPDVLPGQLLAYCGGGDWLNLDHYAGMVNPFGGVENVPTTLSAANTASGEVYNAEITVSSYPDVGTITIPVTMMVMGDSLLSPQNLQVELTDPVTGNVELSWEWYGDAFQFFMVKRDGNIVGTTGGTEFSDLLPGYGFYCYTVQAVYDEGYSIPAGPECLEWPNPDLLVDPNDLHGWVWTGFTVDVFTTIFNNGEGTLAFSFPEYTALDLIHDPDKIKNQAGAPEDIGNIAAGKGEERHNGMGYPVVLGAGGPDDFGYVWIDSDEYGGPAFSWTDISTTGNIVNGLSDDNVVGPFGFDFSFPFYGEDKSQFWINSNGTVGFTSNYISLGNTTIPTGSSTYKDFIAWMWDDLVFRSGQSMVYYQNFPEKTIVQFSNYGRFGQNGGVWAQVIMHNSGKIMILYDQLDAGLSLNSCTVGIQSLDPATGLQVVFNNSYLHDDLAVQFSVPADFIVDVNPASGIVPEGEAQQITVTYDAGDYEPGAYTEDLLLESNDPDSPEWIVNNTMHVYVPARFTGTVTDNDGAVPLNGVIVSAGPFLTETGEDGNYELFVDEGDYDMLFEKPGYLPVTVPDTTALSGSATPVSVGMWDSNNPPAFVTAEVQDDDTWCQVGWAAPEGPYEIVMDDGEADDFFVYAAGGSWSAVKFTPSAYPATVIGGKFYVGDGTFPGPFNGTEFGVAVFDDNGSGGLPGTMLDSTGVTVNNYGWVNLDWLEAIVEDGSFYLAMYQRNNAPHTAPIGIDTDNPTNFRSYSKFQAQPWALSAFQDFMIRAWLTGPQGDNVSLDMVGENRRFTPRLPPNWQVHGMTRSGALPRVLPGYERGAAAFRPVDGMANRDVQNYLVARYSNFDPNGSPAVGTLTELASTTALNYSDFAWSGLPQGWYAYGVKALYTSGLYSEYAVSNIVGHLMDFEVTVHVTLSTGLTPVGTQIILAGLDYPYAIIDTVLSDPGGSILLHPVWKGHYDLIARKIGYDDYLISNTDISSNEVFNILLSEKKYAPGCLDVDPLTLDARWCRPLRTALEEDFEDPEFPPPGWQSLHEPQLPGWFRTDDGSVPGWTIPVWDSYYACSTGDQGSVVSACCDYLITPPLDLRESEGYYLFFDSFFDGAYNQQAYVEYSFDNGATWEVLNQLEPSDNWEEIAIDLSGLSGPNGQPGVWLAFNAYWGGITASGWAIDNVRVQVPVPAASYIDFYVYLNDAFIGSTGDTSWNFIPLTYGSEYTAAVAARYTSGLSDKVYDRFVCKFLYPPRNLVGIAPDDAAILQWDPPLEPQLSPDLLAEEPRRSCPDPFSEYSPTVRTMSSGTGLRDIWDLQLAFATADNTGEAGAETDGDYFYTSMWNGNGFRKYALDGTYLGPVSVGSIGQIRDMAWDPSTQHMFGGQAANTVYEWSFETGTQIGQFTAPTAVRAIAYDPDFDGFWANNWSSTITLFDKEGIQLNSFPVGAYGNYYGFAHDEWSDGGPYLWGYSQDGSGNMIVSIRIATGQETGVTYDASGILINGTGTAGGLFIHPDIYKGCISIGGNSQNDTYFLLELIKAALNPGNVPENLLGYNIYRDSEFVLYQEHQGGSDPIPQQAIDEDLEPGVYQYTVTGVYDLEQFGFPGETGESMEEGPAVVTVDYCFPLEFKETWVHGNFEVNNWTAEGVNWSVSGQAGNPSPAAKFSWDPVQSDYSFSLESYPLCAAGMTEGHIWLDFDVKLETFFTTGDEFLFAEVWNWEDQEWIQVARYSNENGGFPWQSGHIDIASIAIDNVFMIRFRAAGSNSLHIVGWFIDNIHVYRTCDAPDDLGAVADYENNGILLDFGPLSCCPDEWIHYDDGENYTSIGNGGKMEFDVAARWDTGQLGYYDGSSVTQVAFFPASSDATYSIRIWTGSGGSHLVVDQPVPDPVIGQWNHIVLNEPLEIDIANELWIGYHIDAFAGYPAGCDDGPAVNTFGNMINFGGWQSLLQIDPEFDYNWNIQAFVQWLDGSTSPLGGTGSREYQGFNVFRSRDGGQYEWIGYATELPYLDAPLENALYCYKVSAVWVSPTDSCESSFSNEACEVMNVGVAGASVSEANVSLSPNPATDRIIISSNCEIRLLSVYDALGNLLDKRLVNSDHFEMNTSDYPGGLYLARLETACGESVCPFAISQ